MSIPFEMSDNTPVYVISVAAQLSGMHPQTLRAYDKAGLVSPGRTAGGGRRYSLRDILVLREVQRLSQEESINLLGIKRILELEAELQRFRDVLAEMTAEMVQLRTELESTRAVAARLAGLLRSRGGGAELVPVRGQGGSARRPAPAPEPAPDVEHPNLPAAGHGGSASPAPSPGPGGSPSQDLSAEPV